jgi:hypothetical protein
LLCAFTRPSNQLLVHLAESLFSGRASTQNSGFDGRAGWGRDQDTLDHNFYTTLLRNGRVGNFVPELQTNTAPFTNKYLWRESNGRPGFMLNADMALAVNTAGYLNAANGAVTCSLPSSPGTSAANPVCPNSPLLATANRYAANNAAWVTDFRNAFTKMVNKGCDAPTVCTAV